MSQPAVSTPSVASARALLGRCGLEPEGRSDAEVLARAEAVAAAASDYATAPGLDLAARFDEHVADEFELRDVDPQWRR
jgi:hypothetical protein